MYMSSQYFDPDNPTLLDPLKPFFHVLLFYRAFACKLINLNDLSGHYGTDGVNAFGLTDQASSDEIKPS